MEEAVDDGREEEEEEGWKKFLAVKSVRRNETDVIRLAFQAR